MDGILDVAEVRGRAETASREAREAEEATVRAVAAVRQRCRALSTADPRSTSAADYGALVDDVARVKRLDQQRRMANQAAWQARQTYEAVMARSLRAAARRDSLLAPYRREF